MSWLMAWMALSLSVFIVAQIMPGVRLRSFSSAVGVALVYGFLKFLLGQVLFWLSLPLIIVSLGLFYLVINAFLLWITDKLIDGFEIDGFGRTVFTALCISICDVIISWILPGI